ncbi:hypothetical protein GTR02_15130 [Kineococcus sp. R8]|uniref:alpha/beta fold hydrolase n=1 Tax=Kineococcus siccus TaxID=2696567 RepID=UPI0014123F3D|nr:alpha/beta hydrolase [Kineococcus siccus]NAZ83152.1 hypothetical protein [Kineococcus siccus]
MPRSPRSTTRVPTRLGLLAVHTIGEGPTAVLWHSTFTDSRCYQRVVDRLSTRRRLLLVDGPGWGASDPLLATTTLTECALAAEDLLDGVGVTGAVDWVGTAWGGRVGYRLVGTRPGRLRTLVAVNAPTAPLPRWQRHVLTAVSAVLEHLGPVAPVRALLRSTQFTGACRARDPGALALLTGSLEAADPRSQAASLRSFVIGRTDLGPELARAIVPVLIIAGAEQQDLSPARARELAATCRSATAIVVPGARTLLPVERPAEFTAAVLAFWERNPVNPVD